MKVIFESRVLLFSVAFIVLFSVSVVSSRECSNLDIRNQVNSLKLLRGCTVVHGYLQIVLMDGSRNNFTGISFPELREVTGYILFFRVYGLKDIGELFPNLTVIRGNTLFADYALVIYVMPDLRYIGLRNLLHIENGFVRIQSCDQLCYTSSVDWTMITRNETTGNVIPTDRSSCPRVEKYCKNCPIPGRCWNSQSCQKIFSETSPKLYDHCHPQCLGKCMKVDSPSGCYVCRNVSINGTCVQNCPQNTILNQHTNRCITDYQCVAQKRVIHNRGCYKECPANFLLNKSNGACSRCETRCPKKCPGIMLEYVSTAKELKGCTVISGSLIIKINSDVQNIDQELNASLGEIEEIEGFLKISRSNSISSLSFLKSLKTIHGKQLESDKFAVVLFDNLNLKRLFNFTDRNPLQINKGAISVFNNNKLCQSEVTKFIQKTDALDNPNNNVPLNNAGVGECDFIEMKSDFSVISYNNATIYWSPFKPQERNVNVTGYTIYYLETTRDNLEWFNYRESCSFFSWKTKTVEPDFKFNGKKKMLYSVISDLKQVTKYAFYVRSLQSIPGTQSGQSQVKYFTTKLFKLTPPVATTFMKGENSITLNWRAPIKEKPFIEFFHIDVFKLPDNKSQLDSRDYCKYPIVDDPIVEAKERQRNLQEEMEECNCDENLTEDEFSNMQSELYDNMRKLYYGGEAINCEVERSNDICRSYENKIFKRQLYDLHDKYVLNNTIDKRGVSNFESYLRSIHVDNQLDRYTINGLEPFTNYAFEIFSCLNTSECSIYFLHIERTNPILSNDDIRNFTVVHEEYRNIIVTFEGPPKPNGHTLGYRIERRETGDINGNVYETCITRSAHMDNDFRVSFTNLISSSLEFRVRSFSIALEGAWTEWKSTDGKIDEPIFQHVNIIGTIFVICVVCFCITCGIYSYRSSQFNCLKVGDDTVYLMSELAREQENHADSDFFPVDFSNRTQRSDLREELSEESDIFY